MATADDYREEQASIKRGLLRMTSHQLDRGTKWATGDYAHPSGMVTVVRQEPDRRFPNGWTRLDAVVDGRLVYRSWEREWADHSIPKLARQLLGVE
jgi:hypothetical protein